MEGSEGNESRSVTPETPHVKRKVKTALHQAVLDCRMEQVRILVKKHGADVNSQDMYGRTPLMLACLMDNELYGGKMVKLFLEQPTDINLQDDLGRAVLHYSCIKGRERMVRLILGHNDIHVSLPDGEGNTPLMLACICGYVSLVDRLVEITMRYGLPIDQRNYEGYTALLLACQKANFICARILISKGEAQATLKDHKNGWDAKEWVKNIGHSHRAEFLKSRNHTVAGPSMPPRSIATFYRERTMYPDSTIDRSCKHAVSAPAVRSVASALRLPTIFKHLPDDNQPSRWINGGSSRDLLLNAIDSSVVKTRALSRRSKSTRSMASSVLTRFKPPSTAQIRALDEPIKSSTNIKKSVHLLFRIYSERISWDDEPLEASRPHVPKINFKETTPEPQELIY